jgi:hypothetical protein
MLMWQPAYAGFFEEYVTLAELCLASASRRKQTNSAGHSTSQPLITSTGGISSHHTPATPQGLNTLRDLQNIVRHDANITNLALTGTMLPFGAI